MRGTRTVAFFLATLAASLVSVSSAHGAFGEPHFQACVTGLTSVDPPCEAIASAEATDGLASGLRAPSDVVVSADGAEVYATARTDDAVVHFNRDPLTGALSHEGCIAGNSFATVIGSGDGNLCDHIASHTVNGTDSGLDFPTSLALSGDGTSLYVAAQNDDAVGVIDIDPADGSLDADSFDCITGETESGPAGTTGACSQEVAQAASQGADSGLDGAISLDVADDATNTVDDHIYVVAQEDSSIARISADDGALSGFVCRTADSDAGPAPGTTACLAMGPAPFALASEGLNTGFDALISLDVSPDGSAIYTSSNFDAALARLPRAANGGFSFGNCVSGEDATVSTNCDDNGFANSSGGPNLQGGDSGMHFLEQVVAGPDGDSVYAASGGDDAISRFDLDPSTNALRFQACTSGETGSGPLPDGSGACGVIDSHQPTIDGNSGLDAVGGLAVSADGESLYTASGPNGDAAIGHFDRDPATGVLSDFNCLSGKTEATDPPPDGTGACTPTSAATGDGTASGLKDLTRIALSPDDHSIYGTAEDDSAVVQFDREAPPATTIDDGPLAGGVIDTATPTFEFSSTEETEPFFDGFECKLPPTVPDFVACTSPYTPPALPDGAYTFSVQASDTFGFTGAPATRAFSVDATDPPPPPPPPPPDGGGPGAGGGGGGGGPVPDVRAPLLALDGDEKQSDKKRVKVKASADEASTVDAEGTIKVPKLNKNGKVKSKEKFDLKGVDAVDLAAGETTTFKLDFKNKAADLVKKAIKKEKSTAKVTVTAVDAAGNETDERFEIEVKK